MSDNTEKVDVESAPQGNPETSGAEPHSSTASEKSKSGSSSSKTKNPSKVDILLKHAGDAPIMNKRKWTVDRSKRISWVADFIKKYIKSEPSESL